METRRADCSRGDCAGRAKAEDKDEPFITGVSCASKRSAEALLGKVARDPSEAASVPDLSGRNAFPMCMGEEAGYSADDDFSTDAEGVAG